MYDHIKVQPFVQLGRVRNIQLEVGIGPARIENRGLVGKQFAASAANH